MLLKLEEYYIIEEMRMFKALSSLINRNIPMREICLYQ